MGGILSDVRYGVRVMFKNLGFTLVAIASLAVGIGANTAIFSLVRASVFAPLPVHDAGTLVSVFTTDLKNPGNLPVSHYNFVDYRNQKEGLEDLAAFSFAFVSLAVEPEAAQIPIQVVSANYFDVLGVKPARGRAFNADEDRAEGSAPVVVLSNAFWQTQFGGAEDIIGKTLMLNRHAFTVVGVGPQGFEGVTLGGNPALWVPMSMHNQVQPQIAPRQPPYNERRGLFLSLIGRLKPGVTASQAQSALATLAGQLEREYPNDNQGRGIKVVSLLEARTNPDGSGTLWLIARVLMSVAAIVLLIACANVASLLLARATTRRKEVAIRLALGASRAQIIRQFLIESLLLSFGGGVVGFLAAFWSRDILRSITFNSITNTNQSAAAGGLDPVVLGFALVTTIVGGLLFGLAPALQASRPDLVTSLKNDATRGKRKIPRLTLRKALVAGQVGLSLVALIGAGLFIRSLQSALAVNPGFITENVLLLTFNLAREGYNTEQGKAFQRQLAETAGALPGVQAVSFAQSGPFGFGPRRTTFIEGREAESDGRGVSVPTNNVDTGFFETMGIAIQRGRAFDETDSETGPPHVIVNERMASQFWPGEDALGKRIRFSGETFFREIIGIARDSKYATLVEPRLPFAYLSLRQNYSSQMTLHVRTVVDAAALAPAVRRLVAEMDRNLPILNVDTVSARLNRSTGNERANATLLGIFGSLALVLASIGLYGLMSYTVAQRTREIGIRMALGARKGSVVQMMVWEGAKLSMAGVAAGLVAALAMTRTVASLLFGVTATDPATFFAIAGLLLAIALIACYGPARRAAKVDPIVSLRCE